MIIGYTPLVLSLEKQRVKDQRVQADHFDRLTPEIIAQSPTYSDNRAHEDGRGTIWHTTGEQTTI